MSAFEYKQWADIKDRLSERAALQTALGHLLTRKNKLREALFVSLKYPYGALVVDQGKFLLPESVSKLDRKKLLHHLGLFETTGGKKEIRVPLGFVFNNILEASTRIPGELDDCYDAFPQAILPPGTPFGLFELFDEQLLGGNPPPYDVSAGARSAFVTADFADRRVDVRDLLTNAFDNIKFGDEEWRRLSNSLVPLSQMISKVLPKNGYETEVVLVPFSLLDHAESAELKEVERLLFKEAWAQSAHLRNGFIELLAPKKPVAKWPTTSVTGVKLRGLKIPHDWVEPLSRFVYNIVWVKKSQVPGFRLCTDAECQVCQKPNSKAGPFKEFLDVLNRIFSHRCLLFYPAVHRDNPGTHLYLPSRISPTFVRYGNRRACFRAIFNTALNVCRSSLEWSTSLQNVDLVFDENGQGQKLTASFFCPQSQAKLNHKHRFFQRGFAVIR